MVRRPQGIFGLYSSKIFCCGNRKLHYLGQPEALREGKDQSIAKYGARAILTRVMEPLAPDTPKTRAHSHAQTMKFDDKLWANSGEN